MNNVYEVVENVWEDLDEEEAPSLRARAEIMIALREMIHERGMNQHEAAELFGVSQPRISSLVRGKVRDFSLDALIGFLGKMGWSMRIGYAEEQLNVDVSNVAA